MKALTHHILIAAFVASVVPALGQSDDVSVTYNQIDYNKTKQFRDRGIYNLLKVDPVQVLFVGEIPFFYERRVSNALGLEAGVGVTHQEYLSSSDFTDNLTYQIGYSGRLGLRYYPSEVSNALDEYYLGIESRYRNYGSKYFVDDANSPQDGETFGLTRSVVDLTVNGGYIDYFWDNIMVEYYGGIGLAFEDREVPDVDSTFGENNLPIYNYSKDRRIGSGIVIKFGIKVGFGWT